MANYPRHLDNLLLRIDEENEALSEMRELTKTDPNPNLKLAAVGISDSIKRLRDEVSKLESLGVVRHG